MIAYVFQAALLCEKCGEKAKCDYSHNADNADTYFYPQGPYADGGGEADCPQHCDACGVFLENPLTTDGYAFVKNTINTCGESFTPAITEWSLFYSITENQNNA